MNGIGLVTLIAIILFARLGMRLLFLYGDYKKGSEAVDNNGDDTSGSLK